MTEEKKQYGYTVWKFPLKVQDVNEIEVPMGSYPLSVQLQEGDICVWMMVNVNNHNVKRKIFIFGTGHKIDFSEVGRFIGTVQTPTEWGTLVWHVFDEKDSMMKFLNQFQ